jgi:SET domain-containing protein
VPRPQPFEIRDSPIAGRGAFALRRIAKGERVTEYIGERITHAEADRRYDDDSMHEHHTFLFTVSGRTVIDATVDGNDSRYINHSCDPNCESEVVRGRVYVLALRDIAEGEELHYDYAYQRDGTESEVEEGQYRCRCGTRLCRGSIMEPRDDFLRRQRSEARARSRAEARRRYGRAGQTRTTRAETMRSSSGKSRAR